MSNVSDNQLDEVAIAEGGNPSRQGMRATNEDRAQVRNRAVVGSALLSSTSDAVFAIDTDLNITLFNPSAERVSGFSEAEVLEIPYDEILKFESEKTWQPNTQFIHEALAGRMTAMSDHTVLIRKDGQRVLVESSAAPIDDGSGNVQGAIIVFRDVTKAYELDKAKSEFVSLASHQLRAPLSAINWYGEMLLNGDAGTLNKEQREYMEEIFEGNQRMIALVNALLDVSRIEVGKLPNMPELTDIAELVSSVKKDLTPVLETKQLTFIKHIEPVPLVNADPKQLRMVVENLIGNAAKYTPGGGTVTVSLRLATASEVTAAKLTSASPHWYFSVQDTGYGIPKSQQSAIFGKLFRADNARLLDVEGTGLGLYIVKQVVEKSAGRVWFESIESIGSTFYVVLPVGSKGTE